MHHLLLWATRHVQVHANKGAAAQVTKNEEPRKRADEVAPRSRVTGSCSDVGGPSFGDDPARNETEGRDAVLDLRLAAVRRRLCARLFFLLFLFHARPVQPLFGLDSGTKTWNAARWPLVVLVRSYILQELRIASDPSQRHPPLVSVRLSRGQSKVLAALLINNNSHFCKHFHIA